jgi:DNA-binding transcriptional MocR family regulator
MSVERRSWGEASYGTLHRQIARRLGARIVSGEMEEGAALPNEAALSKELGVSRTVVREAVKVLAAKDLLEVRPKTGTKVRPRRDWNMLDPEILEWQFSGPGALAHIRDLLEVRPSSSRRPPERRPSARSPATSRRLCARVPTWRPRAATPNRLSSRT